MKKDQCEEWYNQLIRLTEDQQKDPAAVIRDFFAWYHLDDLREIVSQWTRVALTTDNDVYESSLDRSNLLFFCKQAELLFEAAFLLHHKQGGKKHKKDRAVLLASGA